MKKSLVVLSAMLCFSYFARAQSPQSLYVFTASASGAYPTSSNLQIPANIDALNVRINGIATTQSWTAQIQISPDSVTWTNCGSAVTATAASSSSGGQCTPSGAQYARVYITAEGGTGSVQGALMGTCSMCQITFRGSSAGGDLSGAFPSPSVSGLLGVPFKSLDASLYINPENQLASESGISCQYGHSPLGDSWGAGGGSQTPSMGNWPYYLANDVANGNTDGQFGAVYPYSSAVLGGSNSADFLIDAVSHFNPAEVGNKCAVAVGGINNNKLGVPTTAQGAAYEQQWFGVDAWIATSSNEKLFANNSSQTTLGGTWTSPQYFVSYRSIYASGSNWTVGDIFNVTGDSCSGVTGTVDNVTSGAVTAAHISSYSSTATCLTGSYTNVATSKNTCNNSGCTGLTINLYASPVTEPEEESTGSANTATWSPYIGKSGVFYVYYDLYASSAGTFQVAVGGSAATDTLSGNSTFSCQYLSGTTAPANLGINGAQLGVLRFVTTPETTPTIVFSPTASGKCGVVAIVTPQGTHRRGATAPALVHGLSQPAAQDQYQTNRILYDGYAIAADQQARADGLNVRTVDIAAALDTGNTTQGVNGLDFLASASTIYPNASYSNALPLHPDLQGYEHLAHVLETGGGLAGQPGFAVSQINSPTGTILCINCGNGSSASGGQVRNGGSSPAVEWQWDNYGDLTFNGFTAAKIFKTSGTQTISGCTLSSAHGGPAGGDFTSGVSGACTVTITPGGAPTNGYICSGKDLTTPADTFTQVITGTPTTTAELTGTTVSGDFIQWSCTGY